MRCIGGRDALRGARGLSLCALRRWRGSTANESYNAKKQRLYRNHDGEENERAIQDY